MLANVFRRSGIEGWLIISGPSPAIGDRGIERLLEVVDLSAPILHLQIGDSPSQEIDQWVGDLEALFEVDLIRIDPSTNTVDEVQGHWDQAMMVILTGRDARTWHEFWRSDLGKEIRSRSNSLEKVLYFVGEPGTVLGEWIYDGRSEKVEPGVGWLPGAMILQEMADLAGIEPIQSVLLHHSKSYALNLVGGATIALGPNGEIELWGSPTPSIILGKDWDAS